MGDALHLQVVSQGIPEHVELGSAQTGAALGGFADRAMMLNEQILALPLAADFRHVALARALACKRHDTSPPAAHVGTDDSYLALFEGSPSPVGMNYETIGFNHFGVVVDSLEEARRGFMTSVPRSISSPTTSPGSEPISRILMATRWSWSNIPRRDERHVTGVPVLLGAVGAILLLGWQSTGPPVAIQLVTHSFVVIDRPASAIWPHIVDTSRWKQGLSLRHMGGEVGAVGEVFGAFDPEDPDTIAYLLTNVELIPDERRTIKLSELEHGTLIGYATWNLTDDGGRTRVSYDVYAETRLPPAEGSGLTPQQLAEMTRDGHAISQARFDRELQALKALVEDADP